MKRDQNNLRLNDLQVSVIDHDFVMSANSYECAGGPSPQPDRFVVDPAAVADETAPATLDRIVSRLQSPGPTVIFLRSGIHHLSSPLVVTDTVGPLTIRACPGETPVIEAPVGGPAIILKNSRQAVIAGLVFAGPSPLPIVLDGAEDCVVGRNLFLHPDTAITLDHAQRNKVVENVVRDAAATGIELKDGSDGNLISDNLVDGVRAHETVGGGIFLHGARGNRVAHNTIQQTAGFGIAVSNWDDATINTGNVVMYNLLRHTVFDSADSGAIYVLGRSSVDTGIVIIGNVVDGVGSPGNHNVGIYLDDSTSGAMVIGNLLRAIGSDAVQIHGGQDNLIENNLFDLGAARPSAVLFQAAPADTKPLNRQTGNVVSRNVILSTNASPRPYVWYEGGTPDIAGNFYVWPSGVVSAVEPPLAERQQKLGPADLLPSPSAPGYEAVQRAAELAVGFKSIDDAAAGMRRNPQ